MVGRRLLLMAQIKNNEKIRASESVVFFFTIFKCYAISTQFRVKLRIYIYISLNKENIPE